MFKVRLHRFIDEITGQFGELDTANNEVLDLSDYIVNLSITYSTKAPYETSTIKAKFKDIENILNSFRGANGWVTIHELEKETEKLIFLGVIASVGSGVIASQDGKISSMEITIQAQSWLSIIMKARFLVVNDNSLNEAKNKRVPIKAGLFGVVDFYKKLIPILKDFLNPTKALKTVYSLFSNFEVPRSLSEQDLSKVAIISTLDNLSEYQIKRSFSEIIALNFNTIQPSINGGLWALLQTSFIGGMDDLIELFPSLEEVSNTKEISFTLSNQSTLQSKNIKPCLIYRLKPLDDKTRSTSQPYQSSDYQAIQNVDYTTEARNIEIDGQQAILIEGKTPSYGSTIDTNKYEHIKISKEPAIRVDNVISFSIDYNTENRLNLVDITTKITGVTPLIGTVTDYIYDAISINRYGASSFIETFPFFGRDDNKDLKDYAFELSKYYTALYADGHRLGNVRVQCYYAKQVRHGEYIEFVISNGLSTQYLRGYCISVTHSHSALNDGRIQQRTEFTLERAYYYEA